MKGGKLQVRAARREKERAKPKEKEKEKEKKKTTPRGWRPFL
jgi:hypothetical protein